MTMALVLTSRLSIAAGFLSLGVFMGMWGVLIPERCATLGFSELDLSLFLLMIGFSLCGAVFCVTRFASFQNSSRLIRIAAPLYTLGFALLLTTETAGIVYIVGIMTGFTAGLIDTALNGQASDWERLSRRRGMSFFHALFSLGALCGAAIVTLFLSLAWPVTPIIFGVAILAGGFLAQRRNWINASIMGATPHAGADQLIDEPGKTSRLPPGLVLFLGTSIALATFTEGGVLDWSALHLTKVMSFTISEAGRSIVLFSIAITVSRFCGDWLADRFAPHLLLAVPLMLAGLLLAIAMLLANTFLLLTAYVGFGLALGNAFPLIISLAGRAAGANPLRDISMIVGCAYFGLIAGPAFLGIIAHLVGLNATIMTLAGTALLLAIGILMLPRVLSDGRAP